MASRLNFERIAAAALASAASLLAEWLPQGHRDGHEYKALNPTRADSREGSFSINLNSGAWADFATDDKGGDLVSLYAYLEGIKQGAAAQAIAQRLGILQEAPGGSAGGATKSSAGGEPDAPAEAREARRTDWVPILPVPDDAPARPRAHVKRGRPELSWDYRDRDGKLLGAVYRFKTSDGGKEVLPCCYAENGVTHARDWRWLSFPKPRPLYGLQHLGDDRPVLVVEGEKCADAATTIIGDTFAVITWPGGSKAVDKADWKPLAGRNVIIWPDCDAQLAGDGKPLPEAEQPGVRAAERIAELLSAAPGGGKVRVLAIPAPGEKPAGWDIADAITDGWTREQLLDFLKTRQRSPALAKWLSTQVEACAGVDMAAWEITREKRIVWDGKKYKDCRENAIYLLRDHPEWQGVLAADIFGKRIVMRRPSPIGQAVGEEWGEHSSSKLGLWFQEGFGLQMRSLDVMNGAVAFVASENEFHPVREFLDPLVWDGVRRIDAWAINYLGAPDNEYTRLVSRFFLINLVRRIYEPGCVMRSVIVLEGPQDKGKSTALRMLAQPWFSDTPFRVGDKDSYQLIQGILLYEISELESFSRAEATAVKAFISSSEDNFRAPYARQNEKHRRQTVFAATTNAVEYLKDWTGNTRFWPLPTGDIIDFEGVAAARDQLLAEATIAYRDGARTYPTPEQQESLFRPEQDRRMMAHPWLEIVANWMASPDGRLKDTVTLSFVMSEVLKLDLARINAQGSEGQRTGQILHALGYTKHRASDESRSHIWRRPVSNRIDDDDVDSVPF